MRAAVQQLYNPKASLDCSGTDGDMSTLEMSGQLELTSTIDLSKLNRNGSQGSADLPLFDTGSLHEATPETPTRGRMGRLGKRFLQLDKVQLPPR